MPSFLRPCFLVSSCHCVGGIPTCVCVAERLSDAHWKGYDCQVRSALSTGALGAAAQPLAEVFGRVITDQSEDAVRYRSKRLCPFNNKVPNCTKDKAKDPLGVCSVLHDGAPAITCPVRFREDWLIADDAASFFFDDGVTWSSLIEVRLNDANGKSAGNIDVVLVAYDDVNPFLPLVITKSAPPQNAFATSLI